MSNSLQPHGLWPARLLSPWGFFSQEHWSGLPCPLQGIFQTQGLNPGLPHCRWILCHLSHQGSPRILEWVAYPFSRGSFLPRNLTAVSCIVGRFFTSWPTKESPDLLQEKTNGQSGISPLLLVMRPWSHSVRGDLIGNESSNSTLL